MFTLAHYWGVDEVVVFVVPALLALWALRWAGKKAARSASAKKASAGATVDGGDSE